uniref:Uncharacterized protein n=1 Tax=Glossina austeni TaxID=7395 RepID=A0A1A9VVA9_GLOAU
MVTNMDTLRDHRYKCICGFLAEQYALEANSKSFYKITLTMYSKISNAYMQTDNKFKRTNVEDKFTFLINRPRKNLSPFIIKTEFSRCVQYTSSVHKKLNVFKQCMGGMDYRSTMNLNANDLKIMTAY